MTEQQDMEQQADQTWRCEIWAEGNKKPYLYVGDKPEFMVVSERTGNALANRLNSLQTNIAAQAATLLRAERAEAALAEMIQSRDDYIVRLEHYIVRLEHIEAALDAERWLSLKLAQTLEDRDIELAAERQRAAELAAKAALADEMAQMWRGRGHRKETFRDEQDWLTRYDALKDTQEVGK